MARPVVKPGHPHGPLGGHDVDVRPAYGVRWSGPKRFFDQAKGCLNVLRKQFEELMEGDIVWEPYVKFLGEGLNLAPPTIIAEQHLWCARVEMVHFWMVEFHYPDRVMRQFGRKQDVPPRLPEPWEGHEAYMLYEHSKDSNKRRPNWEDIHARHIQVVRFPLI